MPFSQHSFVEQPFRRQLSKRKVDFGIVLLCFRISLLGIPIEHRARIFKLSMSPGNDSKEPIPPAYVAWRAGTTTLFLLGS